MWICVLGWSMPVRHRAEFSHWRCQLALGDGKKAWVGSAVTSSPSRTSLPPSHFIFPSPPLRIFPVSFIHSVHCICSTPCLFLVRFRLPALSTPSLLVPLLLLCHSVYEPRCLIMALCLQQTFSFFLSPLSFLLCLTPLPSLRLFPLNVLLLIVILLLFCVISLKNYSVNLILNQWTT